MKNPAMPINQLEPNSVVTNNKRPAAKVPSVSLYPVEQLKFLLFNGPDMISRHLRMGQYWEKATIECIQNFLNMMDSPVFIDIGANLGAISIPIAKFLEHKNGKVFSFEAQRGVYYQLCANIFSNQLVGTCTAYHIAIGNTDGQIEVPQLDLSLEANVGSLSLDEDIRQQQRTLSTHPDQFEAVTLKQLDTLELPAASLIKIDVEGLELEVVQGAVNYLKSSNNPPIFFEIWGDHMKKLIPKRTELLNLIKQLGYETTILGELCIAQHSSNKFFDIKLDADRTVSFTKLH